MLFDKAQRQFFKGDLQPVLGAIQQSLYGCGITLQQTGQATWSGQGNVASYGLIPKVSLTASPSPEGFCLDIRLGADPDGSGLAVFIVMWFLFFPVAIILGYLAYQDFNQRQAIMFNNIWGPVAHLMVAPNFAPTFGPPPVPFSK